MGQSGLEFGVSSSRRGILGAEQSIERGAASDSIADFRNPSPATVCQYGTQVGCTVRVKKIRPKCQRHIFKKGTHFGIQRGVGDPNGLILW